MKSIRSVFLSVTVFIVSTASIRGESISISGTVNNRTTGGPVADVQVMLEGENLSTSTDEAGSFTLRGNTTAAVSLFAAPWVHKAFWNGRGIVVNVPGNSSVQIDIFSLAGRRIAAFSEAGLSRGQWELSASFPHGTFLCRARINDQVSAFKFQGSGSKGRRPYLRKVCDLDENPVPAATVASSEGYTLSFSKRRFATSRQEVSSGTVPDLSVALDSIAFATDMNESQTRTALADIIGTDSIIFIKRFTLNSNHYYTEHVNSDWLPGGNICILNLQTGAVGEVIKDRKFSNGVIKRFDLSHDAKKVVFDFRSSHETGYRIYEAEIATGTVRQITFPQANEDSLVQVYKCNGTQCGDQGRNLSCDVTYHHGTDDMDPCYLPDGGIVFVSTRCQIGIPCDAADCFTTTNLYRVESDGSGMRPLSRSMASEFQPSVMPDGRIVYARWEYVDKASAAAKCIWSMYPNGTGSAEVFKNDINVPPSFVQPRFIPGSDNKFVILATAHCCYQGQYGTVIRLDMNKNIRSREPMEYITREVDSPDHTVLSWPLNWGRGNTYRDPYPLAEDLYLVSHKPGSVSMDWWDKTGYGLYALTDDNTTLQFYRDNDISCWQPMPLKPRPKEPSVNIPLDPDLAEENQAICTVNDIYFNTENVPRGSIKYIRVLEQIPRTWAARHWWGGDDYGLAHAAVERNTHLGLQVQWGIVPVESDGSANFIVPANRAIFFHALDSNFQVVQHERTYVNYMPGERRGCTGCHETPDMATPIPSKVPIALQREPSVPGPQPGDTTGKILLDYEKRVQPIWDKHCTSCHNSSNKSGNLDLSGTQTGIFSVSYDQLMDRRNWLLGFYIDEDPRNPVETTKYLPAYSMYSNCILLKMLGVPITLRDIDGAPTYLARWRSRYGAKADELTADHADRFSLSREERIKVSNWIQSNLQFRGTYWGRFHVNHKGRADYRPDVTFDEAIGTERPY